MKINELLDSRCIKTDDEHWIWQGSVDGDGYPIITLEGKQYRMRRLVYSAYKEPVPRYKSVLSRCKKRQCLNPDHLECLLIKVPK